MLKLFPGKGVPAADTIPGDTIDSGETLDPEATAENTIAAGREPRVVELEPVVPAADTPPGGTIAPGAFAANTNSRRETESEPTTKLDAAAPTAQNTIAAGRTSELDDTAGTPAAAEPGLSDTFGFAEPTIAAVVPSGAVESKFELGATVEPKVDVILRAATLGNSLPADRPDDTAKRKIATAKRKIGPAPGVVGLGGDGSGAAAAERTIAEVVPSDAIGFVEPTIAAVVPSGAVENKFEPDATVEPKVGVILGVATQGNSHPADRPGNTAKRKITRERQGRGGRPEPGSREVDAAVGRSTGWTARRGGYQTPSCLARGRS